MSSSAAIRAIGRACQVAFRSMIHQLLFLERDPDAKRFLREARLACALKDEGIVRGLGFGTDHGLHYTEIDRQRAQELRDLIAEAEAISQEHPKISFDRALELLEQRSPNPIMQNQGQGRPQTSEPKAKASGMTFNVADPRPRHWKFERNEAGEVTGLLTEENQ